VAEDGPEIYLEVILGKLAQGLDQAPPSIHVDLWPVMGKGQHVTTGRGRQVEEL
jgi:hypothetical protein